MTTTKNNGKCASEELVSGSIFEPMISKIRCRRAYGPVTFQRLYILDRKTTVHHDTGRKCKEDGCN
jgi:hypothetical protein